MFDMINDAIYRIDSPVIKSFADAETYTFWETGSSKKTPPSNLRSVAKRKLDMVNAARQLADLKAPPSNKLHALEDDRKGQHAIRINDQYRVCFTWKDGDAYNVEIIDYHELREGECRTKEQLRQRGVLTPARF